MAQRFPPNVEIKILGSAYNRLLAGLERVDTLEREVKRLTTGLTSLRYQPPPPWFYIRIDGFLDIGSETNRRRYSWTKMTLSGAVADGNLDDFEELTDGDPPVVVRSATTSSDYALNLAEMGDDADHPAAPVPDNTIVKVWLWHDANGVPVFLFNYNTSGTGFWALITGFQAMGSETNRWEYSWKQGIWDNTAKDFIAKSGGLTSNTGSGDFDDPAYNSIETANQGTGIESGGVDVGGVDYAASSFALVPLRGESDGAWADNVSPAVWLRPHIGDDGNRVWIFQLMNAHDGGC